MPCNEGKTDRMIRGAVAVVGVVVAIATGFNALGIVALVVGAIMGITAATGFCPIYRVLNVSTCQRPN
jgi:hypothetical protein